MLYRFFSVAKSTAVPQSTAVPKSTAKKALPLFGVVCLTCLLWSTPVGAQTEPEPAPPAKDAVPQPEQSPLPPLGEPVDEDEVDTHTEARLERNEEKAAADDVVAGPNLKWRFAEFNETDLVITSVSASAILLSRLVGPQRDSPRQGPMFFDKGVRDSLVLRSRNHQNTILDFSDLTLSLATSWPFLDAFIVVLGMNNQEETAIQMSLINIEVMGVLAALQTIANAVVSRERPYGSRCGGELSNALDDCVSDERYYSFFSGHSALSFGSAALVCTHHSHYDLYGGIGDTLACAGAYALATFTAAARVMGDKHYATDVLTGAAIGTLVGYLLPYLSFYSHEKEDEQRRITIAPTGNGLSVFGWF